MTAARGLSGIKALKFVEGYMKESASDAVARLKQSPRVLRTIAKANLAEAQGIELSS